jgi:hypothetical protein
VLSSASKTTADENRSTMDRFMTNAFDKRARKPKVSIRWAISEEGGE